MTRAGHVTHMEMKYAHTIFARNPPKNGRLENLGVEGRTLRNLSSTALTGFSWLSIYMAPTHAWQIHVWPLSAPSR
jgi:hypothetical protein